MRPPIVCCDMSSRTLLLPRFCWSSSSSLPSINQRASGSSSGTRHCAATNCSPPRCGTGGQSRGSVIRVPTVGRRTSAGRAGNILHTTPRRAMTCIKWVEGWCWQISFLLHTSAMHILTKNKMLLVLYHHCNGAISEAFLARGRECDREQFLGHAQVPIDAALFHEPDGQAKPLAGVYMCEKASVVFFTALCIPCVCLRLRICICACPTHYVGLRRPRRAHADADRVSHVHPLRQAHHATAGRRERVGCHLVCPQHARHIKHPFVVRPVGSISVIDLF